ncbi:MAG TPA: protein phosphatase 2C domain-containing protein [Ktedonobacterales bacterium]|jgi:serine/threonine protein phosphatase PrpC/rRNA maturation endonuclease Nob1
MRCVQCGAELRPNARFCNVCGADQSQALAQAASQAEGQHTVIEPQPAAPAPVAPIDGDEVERAKRPPRIPRASDDEPEVSADNAPAVTLPVEAVVSQANGATAPNAAVEGAQTTGDLSWPLPEQAVVAGRYQVQRVVSAAETQDGENVYRVVDLRGNEKCWSCGTEYAVSDDPQRFCPECGADMLGHELTLHERIAVPDETPTQPLSEANLPPAPGGEPVIYEHGREYRVEADKAETPPFPSGVKITIGAASDIGVSRQGGHNEDSIGHVVLEIQHDSYAEPLALAVVADGLGGHASGREASRLVVRTLLDHVLRTVALPRVELLTDAPATEEGLKHILREGIQAANEALCTANDEQKLDMGSTVVAVLAYEGTAYVANAGDSRAYVLEGETLRRITIDHSLVEQLVAGGIIADADRYTHPERNQIFRSLGLNREMEIDFFTQWLRPGMRLLLCSDGLWEMVRDNEITRIMRANPDPQAACDALIQAANKAGGEDNISAVVVQIGA